MRGPATTGLKIGAAITKSACADSGEVESAGTHAVGVGLVPGAGFQSDVCQERLHRRGDRSGAPCSRSCHPTRAADPPIRLNTIGFLPDSQKRASIAAPCSEFTVVRLSDGARVISGRVGEPAVNADTNEKLTTADFSALKRPGLYYLDVPGIGRSPEFRIAADVYNFPFSTVMRGMYLWRCGTADGGPLFYPLEQCGHRRFRGSDGHGGARFRPV